MQALLGCLGIIIILAIAFAILGFILNNILGFIGIGIAIWAIYEWSVNRKIQAKSKKPAIILTFALALTIIGFTPVDDNASSSANQEAAEEVSEEKETKEETELSEVEEEESSGDSTEAKTTSETPSKEEKEFDVATVTDVVDGDTMDVTFKESGETDTVRLLLIDTPETKHPDLPTQEWGPEASAFAEEHLAGEEVHLYYDEDKRDTYDRLLVYLHVDGEDFNKQLLEEGLARVAYVWEPNTSRLDEYYSAEEKAKKEDLNIWSVEGYVAMEEDGGYNQDVIDPPEPVVQEEESTTTSASTDNGYSGPYDPNGADRNCGDFNSHAEAQAFFIAAGGPSNDPHRLDGNDNDGLACESLP
ncbi:hypothetical protein N781_08940 [Pontibacillus halophilus JSM 076056 = DSM 19796]|uniref:TNase-like domain-containing protein n=1 Tax=Pontibacillus halophilus JSM 076056 = DSM 19796 TaxID=1385510 RepID=A0A0A5GF40_9BACI|nr:thermonuclease family protein [Pontibacillus halophilus]KGX89833.1 hypothetical protein N781_08940 [Pontibacillus halophilus JSM 076056 = DSM 19796]